MIQLLSLPHPRDLQPVQYIMIMAHSQHHALDRSAKSPQNLALMFSRMKVINIGSYMAARECDVNLNR